MRRERDEPAERRSHHEIRARALQVARDERLLDARDGACPVATGGCGGERGGGHVGREDAHGRSGRRERLAGEQRERIGLLPGCAGDAPDAHGGRALRARDGDLVVPVDRGELPPVTQERRLLDRDLVDQPRDRVGGSGRVERAAQHLGVRDARPAARERSAQRVMPALLELNAGSSADHLGDGVQVRAHRSAPFSVSLHSSAPISVSGSTRSTPPSAAARGMP